MIQQWWVYMVDTQSGKLYTGITTDVERRFREHCQTGSVRQAKFFRFDQAQSVVYQQAVKNRSEASKREAAIKKLTRNEKRQLAGLL